MYIILDKGNYVKKKMQALRLHICESYLLTEPIPNTWITIIATIRPTKPCEPNEVTILEILPITSPIIIFEPNKMFAKIPNPIRPTNTDDNPPTND